MDGPLFHVQLLGGFSIDYEEKPVVTINTSRLQSLLAYLVLNADLPQSRQHVAYLLWPDTSESNARNNLRQFLYQLRRLLPDPDRFLFIDTNTICWQLDEDQSIDVLGFNRALLEADAAEKQGDFNAVQQRLKEALALYQGDLLPSCYDDWIITYREEMKQRCIAAAQKLVRVLEGQREYTGALQSAQSLLHLDPLDENTYLTLMRLHDLNMDHPAARRVYQSAVETLQRELGVEPGENLKQAYERVTRPHGLQRSERTAAPLALVGRQGEWQQLQGAWQLALNGDSCFVLITGEAGIGKSRLAEELFNWANDQGYTAVHTRSYAAEGRLSFAPVIEWLRSKTLGPYLATLEKIWLTEVTRLLPELLTENADLDRPGPIGEIGQRQHFFEALARAVLAAPSPTLLWIDDLQWCDPETIEWLHFLLRFKPHHPLLVLGTARSEESPLDHPLVGLARQIRGEGKLISIELSPLDAAETARLASTITGSEMDISTTMHLFRETEGNPLFVVETVRAGRGGRLGDESVAYTRSEQDPHVMPPRVHAVIAGRLAQLSPIARSVAELGAAIGRAFTFDVLLRAGQEGEANIIRALDELWHKRILREQSPNVFDFTHDKLREVAYDEISAPQRRLLHRRIAQALEIINSANPGEVSAQIAAHFEQAGMYEQAFPYFQRAGEFAAGIYANEDAIDLYMRGLTILAKIPAGTKRDTQELVFQLALATLYRLSKGWAAPEEERVINRAMVLSEKVGTADQRIDTLFGMQMLYVVQAKFEKVEQTYDQAAKLYLQTHNSPPPPFAGIYVAGARMFMGKMTEAREQFEKIVAVRDDRHIRDLQVSQGLNYLVHGLAWNAHVYWCLGYPQTAMEKAGAAIAFGREFEQPFNQALAITYMAMLQEWCVEPTAFLKYASEAFDFASTYKAPYYQAWANILVSFAQAQQQPGSRSIELVNHAINVFAATGAHARLPVYFSLLARACQQAGQIDLALEAIDSGLDESCQNGEHWWDAELHRLRGELIWLQGADASDVENAFQRAIEIAQSQQAKSLELRAAMSLARFWQANGRPMDSKQLLVPLYTWFSEGFDTPDLQIAQKLIEAI